MYRTQLMSYHEIAPGVEIPVLGLGTWGMGGRQIEDHRWDSENVTAIRMAIELGFTHIDTAEYYGAGHAEELVGEAIESYPRDSLFITTKVCVGTDKSWNNKFAVGVYCFAYFTLEGFTYIDNRVSFVNNNPVIDHSMTLAVIGNNGTAFNDCFSIHN